MGDRLHLQHGPIDLIIGADGPGRTLAFAAATKRFETVLTGLVVELPLLRAQVMPGGARPDGPIAKRMDDAVRPHSGVFITPMAAVAGAVADEVLAAMVAAADLPRAYVNNGGDIALHLTPGHRFTAAMAGLGNSRLGQLEVAAETPVRGIATSGQGGRSLSLGIADSVTVLARMAAAADAAATLIANAVDLPGHRAILRTQACEMRPDSDLGGKLVVQRVGALTVPEVDTALAAGAKTAQQMLASGLISGAALFLRGRQRLVGTAMLMATEQQRESYVTFESA
jgi:ApbE superfamily uncharacterized protein (UPF0280 family)